MPLDFPNNPTLNQAYSAGGKTWTFNGSRWVVLSAAAQPISALNDIQDVTITSASNGQFLKWNGSAWVNDNVPVINNLNDIGDVTITSASSGQLLQWNGTAWVNASFSSDVMTDARNAALILMDIGA